jgi:hypothetical protein
MRGLGLGILHVLLRLRGFGLCILQILLVLRILGLISRLEFLQAGLRLRHRLRNRRLAAVVLKVRQGTVHLAQSGADGSGLLRRLRVVGDGLVLGADLGVDAVRQFGGGAEVLVVEGLLRLIKLGLPALDIGTADGAAVSVLGLELFQVALQLRHRALRILDGLLRAAHHLIVVRRHRRVDLVEYLAERARHILAFVVVGIDVDVEQIQRLAVRGGEILLAHVELIEQRRAAHEDLLVGRVGMIGIEVDHDDGAVLLAGLGIDHALEGLAVGDAAAQGHVVLVQVVAVVDEDDIHVRIFLQHLLHALIL